MPEDFQFDAGTSFDGHKGDQGEPKPKNKGGRPRTRPVVEPPPEIGKSPLPTPENLPAEAKGRRGMPRSGKYPFRKPKGQQKRQKGHAWALSGEWKPIFLEALARYGTITAAADRADINFATVGNHRKADPEFDAACKEAMQRCRDSMVMDMYRRAFEGVEKFAWDKKNNERVSLGKQPDPILTMFAIKQIDPSFRENHKSDEEASLAQAMTNLVSSFLKDGFKPHSDDQAEAPTLEVFAREITALPPPPETTEQKRARLLAELAALDAEPEKETDGEVSQEAGGG